MGRIYMRNFRFVPQIFCGVILLSALGYSRTRGREGKKGAKKLILVLSPRPGPDAQTPRLVQATP